MSRGTPPTEEAELADAGRDPLDRQDRAVHGVSAARRGAQRRSSPCTSRRWRISSRSTPDRRSIEFTPETGGAPKVLVGPEPSRPGAFRVEDVPPAAGTLSLGARSSMRRGSRIATISGTITVFARRAERQGRRREAAADDAAAIAYLKETAVEHRLRDRAACGKPRCAASIRVPATIHPLPGGEAIVAAPAAGRFTATSLLSIGDSRPRGPGPRAASSRGSLPDPTAPRSPPRSPKRRRPSRPRASSRTRAERLLADRAVPARRVEDAQPDARRRGGTIARSRSRLAQTGRNTANRRWRRRRQRVRAARADRRTSGGGAWPRSGASYDEGAPLFRIVRTDRVELEVQVPSADVAARATARPDVALEIPGVAAAARTRTTPRARLRASSIRRRARCRCRWRLTIPASNC